MITISFRKEKSLTFAAAKALAARGGPDGTKKGEGVVVAVIDDGFLINAEYVDDNKQTKTVTHKAYSALGEGIATPLTQANIQEKIAKNPGFHGKKDGSHSTYLNNKVPFYYDYGGDGTNQEDYDVFFHKEVRYFTI